MSAPAPVAQREEGNRLSIAPAAAPAETHTAAPAVAAVAEPIINRAAERPPENFTCARVGVGIFAAIEITLLVLFALSGLSNHWGAAFGYFGAALAIIGIASIFVPSRGR